MDPSAFQAFFSSNYFSSTDYFQVYLFVEFLGGTIRFEFLDKRDFWTTPTVERYQEQFVGAAAESNHRIGPTGCWPSSFWRVRYTWCCGARGKLQRLYGVGDGRSRREGMEDERSVSDHLWLLEWARQRMDGRTACAVHVCFFTTRSRQEESGTEQTDVEAKRITVLTKSQQATMDV